MRILMISLDRNLLGLKKEGDTLERHKKYAEFAESLDVIVFNRNNNLARQEKFNKLEVYSTNSSQKINYIFDAYRIGKNLCQQKKIDLIDTQDPFLTGLAGYFLKKKFKIPLEIHCHGDFFENKYWLRENFLNYFYLLLGKFIIKRADAIRVVSRGIKDKLVKMGISGNKIKVISTPVDLDKFQMLDLGKVQEIKGQYKNKKIILFIGTLNKVKNIPLLLDSLALVKREFNDFICLVIGEGPEINSLKLKISNLKLEDHIKLLGSIRHDELANYYGASDFLVLSSFSESFGKVIVEAAASGKPAIATKTTGASELIIDKETGYLTEIDNREKLAEKILSFLRDENLSARMGQKAKELVSSKFKRDEIIKSIIAFWQEICNN